MTKREPGQDRRKIIPPGRARKNTDMPTTGNGRDNRQKPKLSETNLRGNDREEGFIAPLIRRVLGGKHQGK